MSQTSLYLYISNFKPDSSNLKGWTTVAVLVRKQLSRTKADMPYSKWTLSNLSGNDVHATLFGDAHRMHYTMVSRLPVCCYNACEHMCSSQSASWSE